MKNKSKYAFILIPLLANQVWASSAPQCKDLFSSTSKQISALPSELYSAEEVQSTLEALVKLYYQIHNRSFEKNDQIKQAQEKLAQDLSSLLKIDSNIIHRFNKLIRDQASVEKAKLRELEKAKEEVKTKNRVFLPKEKYRVEHPEDKDKKKAKNYFVPSIISPDGKYLVMISLSENVKVVELLTGKIIYNTKHLDVVNHLKISPDGKYLVIGSSVGKAKVTELATGKFLYEFNYENSIDNLSISPDGKYIVAKNIFKGFKVIELVTGKSLYEVKSGYQSNHSNISPDGKYIVTVSDDGIAKVRDLATGKLLYQVKDSNYHCNISMSSDSKYLVILSGKTDVVVRNLGNGKILYKVERNEPVDLIEISPDGKYLVTSSIDHTAKVTELATGKFLYQFMYQIKYVNDKKSLMISPDGKYLVTYSKLGDAQVRELATGEILLQFKSDIYKLESMISSDWKFLVTISELNEINITDLATGNHLYQDIDFKSTIAQASITPDGNHLVITHYDLTAKVIQLYRTVKEIEDDK